MVRDFKLFGTYKESIAFSFNFSENGFIGLSFYKRDVHVVEVQIGAQTKRKEDALNAQYFNKSSLPYVSLVSK